MFLHVFVLFLWVKSTAIWKKLKKESKKEKSNTENDHFSFFSGHLEKWPQQEVHPKISNVTHQYCILGIPRLQKNIGSLRCGGGARWSYLATRLTELPSSQHLCGSHSGLLSHQSFHIYTWCRTWRAPLPVKRLHTGQTQLSNSQSTCIGIFLIRIQPPSKWIRHWKENKIWAKQLWPLYIISYNHYNYLER